MPAAIQIQPRANHALNTPGSANYLAAKEAVATARTIREAVDNGNLLDDLDASLQTEAHNVLDQVPAAVNDGFMGSLRSALNNNAKIHFTWGQHTTGGYDYSVSTDIDGTVQLGLRTPPG
jgi:hypothetical protein